MVYGYGRYILSVQFNRSAEFDLLPSVWDQGESVDIFGVKNNSLRMSSLIKGDRQV